MRMHARARPAPTHARTHDPAARADPHRLQFLYGQESMKEREKVFKKYGINEKILHACAQKYTVGVEWGGAGRGGQADRQAGVLRVSAALAPFIHLFVPI